MLIAIIEEQPDLEVYLGAGLAGVPESVRIVLLKMLQRTGFRELKLKGKFMSSLESMPCDVPFSSSRAEEFTWLCSPVSGVRHTEICFPKVSINGTSGCKCSKRQKCKAEDRTNQEDWKHEQKPGKHGGLSYS